MANSTEREPGRFRLAMDNGEVVEVDGSTLIDDDSGQTVTAVVLRLPRWRAHAVAHVLASWNEAVDLFERVAQVSQDESDLSWALYAASSAAEVLREREAFELHTLIAVVDAAAWWLDQPRGDTYCTSLLEAVTDQATVGAAYLALVGGGEVEPPEEERSG
jgi:hypothetical protein